MTNISLPTNKKLRQITLFVCKNFRPKILKPKFVKEKQTYEFINVVLNVYNKPFPKTAS